MACREWLVRLQSKLVDSIRPCGPAREISKPRQTLTPNASSCCLRSTWLSCQRLICLGHACSAAGRFRPLDRVASPRKRPVGHVSVSMIGCSLKHPSSTVQCLIGKCEVIDNQRGSGNHPPNNRSQNSYRSELPNPRIPASETLHEDPSGGQAQAPPPHKLVTEIESSSGSNTPYLPSDSLSRWPCTALNISREMRRVLHVLPTLMS